MTEDSTNRWLRFRFDQIEQRGYSVVHGFPTRRNIPGISQVNCVILITSQCRGRDQAGHNSWLKKLSVPLLVIRFGNRSRILAGKHFGHGGLHF